MKSRIRQIIGNITLNLTKFKKSVSLKSWPPEYKSISRYARF